MNKEKIIEFAIPEEDTEYVESIRIYNIRIPLEIIMKQILPLIKKGKICLNCGRKKENKEKKCFRHSRIWGNYYQHDWAYRNKKERKCLACGKVEIYFGYSGHGEDWRKKLTN